MKRVAEDRPRRGDSAGGQEIVLEEVETACGYIVRRRRRLTCWTMRRKWACGIKSLA